jgi:hypothetical protein
LTSISFQNEAKRTDFFKRFEQFVKNISNAPGYLKQWKSEANESSPPVSIPFPISTSFGSEKLLLSRLKSNFPYLCKKKKHGGY